MCLRVHVAFSVLQERRKIMKRVGMSVFFHNFVGKSFISFGKSFISFDK